MSLSPWIIFPFQAVYIGDASASGTRLTKIRNYRTNGARITEGYPTAWEPALGKRIRTGNYLVTVTMSFYGDNDLVVKIAKGMPLTETDINSAPGENVYSLFLQAPSSDNKSSYYFPNVQVLKTREFNYSKAATLQTITFSCESRDINTKLMYQEKDINLIATMGGKSPI